MQFLLLPRVMVLANVMVLAFGVGLAHVMVFCRPGWSKAGAKEATEATVEVGH